MLWRRRENAGESGVGAVRILDIEIVWQPCGSSGQSTTAAGPAMANPGWRGFLNRTVRAILRQICRPYRGQEKGQARKR